MADTALTNAIEEAANELQEQIEEQEKPNKKDKSDSVSDTEESEDTEESKESSEESGTESDDEPEEEIVEDEVQSQKEALLLYNALKDPKLRGPVLAALVQEAGLKLGSAETKTEEKKEEKAIKQLVAEALGPEYKFLADKLGTVMEQVMDKVEATNAETRQSQLEAQILRESNETLAKLEKETKGESKKLQNKMLGLMDKFPSGPNISVDEYIRGIYKMAAGDRVVQSTKTQLADKIRSNSKNAAERLRSTGGSEPETAKEFRGKGALKNAVQYAADQLESQGKLFRKR